MRPYLEQVPALSIAVISLVLLAYGIGGFSGNLVGGVITARSAQASVVAGAVMIALTSFVLVAFGAVPWIAAIGGAVLGGLLVDTLGPTGVIGYCGLATLLGAALVLIFGGKSRTA